MVTYSFSTKLSKDYVSFYENGKECADVIIRAGREGSVEEFYAHSFVLLIRSNYFRKELEGVKEKNADNKIIIEKPDINPKLFDKILSSASPPPAAENFKETADVSLWTRDKFRDLSNTLKQFIPLIDFYKIKPEDFYEKVKPFKKIIEKPLFEDILKYHIVSSKNLDSTTSKSTSQPTSSPTSTASSPQKDRPEPIFNIRLNSILDLDHFRLFTKWINETTDISSNSDICRPRPGSSGMVGNIPNHGPTFNGALYLKGDFGREYGSICKGNAYTVHIRDIQAPFLVEELEVYQVIKEVHGSNP
ncbi:3174_t:CDS:2 [Funneliformis caledonium]|uniref:3174_t:CDS:1 n=1 Tax=Funneliformis caledonium TaxID=1117310 RepID=A0A9N9G296_9GLOM|nr:3174_t:CDS:2 [Funneliformis caledonium]